MTNKTSSSDSGDSGDGKRIVFIAPHSPEAVGYESQEDFLTMAHYHQKYCQLMVEEGYEVFFLHFGESYRQFEHRYGHTVRQLPVTVGNEYSTELSLRLISELYTLDPDIVHFHGANLPKLLFYLPFTWGLDANLVLQNHGASLDASKRTVKLLYLLFRVVLFPTDCRILSVNRAEMRNLQRATVAESIEYIPNAVDTEFYDRMDTDAVREQVDLPADRSYLLYVGRIDESKGVEYLIGAFESIADRYPDLDMVLVYGAYEDEVLQRIKRRCENSEYSDRFRFVGRVPEENLPRYYNAADICVFPSVNEGFGVVTLEAMSCGVPVVGTTAHTEGEQQHLVDGENALIAEAGSSRSLEDKISTLLENPDLAEEMSNEAYSYVRNNHTWEQIKQQLMSTYSGI